MTSQLQIHQLSSQSMERRHFLSKLAALTCAGLLPAYTQNLLARTTSSQMDREELLALLRTLLITENTELYEFAVDVYTNCVLSKIKPPDPPLAYSWVVPGGGYYAQWLWDTMFVVDLLALLPGKEETIRGVFQNYWDFQQRWNAAKPSFMHGMIANFIAPFDGPEERPGKQWQTFQHIHKRHCWHGVCCASISAMEIKA